MKIENLEGKISINRRSGGNDEQSNIFIEIQDNQSRIKFIEIKINMADFTAALTGHSFIPVIFKTNNLEYIGKTKETEKAAINIPHGVRHDKKSIETYLEEVHQRDGWIIDTYLGSQNSLIALWDDPDYYYTANISYHRYMYHD